MFKKILIANRGEIACRVMRTAAGLGVKTVAVYSDADSNAMHVALADEAVRIGPAPVSESYLLGDVIIKAALETGAEAIHPGYGFLSENPEFVEQTEQAGLRFIGPSASAIRAMGLKDAAKKLMQQAGVPVVPGYHGEEQDAGFLATQAQEIGYPVLIKARAGGGGKGMRLVEKAEDFAAALASAQREAQASFADAACLIEKYITSPRHIEIQVFGDDHGNVVHLFERDCSLQRRHQKVIEEAPAPGMSLEMREAMGQAAVEAAKAINYSGAGTIEFIVDSSEGLQPDRFWFMEMNTRLQVEHPVTEAITNCDLVEWQLRVASGQSLPLTQDQLTIDGWSVEARIYAEDVEKGFLPATGTLHYLKLPEDVRVDTGVRQGDTISPFYDPMIAKLTVHGADRDSALRLMEQALSDSHAAGSVTNINFLSALIKNKEFAAGDVDTGLIERNSDQLTSVQEVPAHAIAVASVESASIDSNDMFCAFRLWQPLEHTVVLTDQYDATVAVKISCENSGVYRVEINDQVHSLIFKHNGKVEFDGETLPVTSVTHAAGVSVYSDRAWHFTVPDPLAGSGNDADGGDNILAPMPGQIKVVNKSAGDSVEAGEALVVLEAMKMEHTLTSPRDGIIAEVMATVGEQVEDGAILLALVEQSD